MLSKKKKKMVIIASIIGIVVVTLIMLVLTLYLNTDAFKNKNSLFIKYIIGNIGNSNSGIEKIVRDNELDNKLKQDTYTSKTSIKFNATQNIDTEENTNNSINQFSIDIDGSTDNSNNYNYKNIKLLNNNEEKMLTEYVKNNDTYGVRFPELFEQYILVDNNNLKDLFKNAEYEDVTNIPNTIEISDNISDYITFTNEEINQLENKYKTVIEKEIKNRKINKNSSENITINGETLKVNSYTMSLTKEEINDLFLKILETAKDDEIILGKLENIDNLTNIYYAITKNTNNIALKEDFQANIENMISKINRTNIGNDETKIIVYENNKNTVRTTVHYVDYEINIDAFENNGTQYIELNIDDTKNSKTKTITLSNYNGMNSSLEIADTIDNKISKIKIKKNDELNDNEGKRQIEISYEDSSNNIITSIEEDIKFIDDINMINTRDNSVKLNELPEENLKNVINQLKNSLTEKFNIVFSEEDKNDFNQILKIIGLVKEQQTIEAGEITETQKNRFNSKFEFLQGNEMKSEQVSNMIDVAKENIINLDVVSNTTMKIQLDMNNRDDGVYNKLKNFIESKDNSRYNYNVSIEYDEIGLAKYIVLDIITE